MLPNEKKSYFNIPELVVMLTMVYYWIPEYFAVHGKRITLNEDGTTFNFTSLTQTTTNTAYGNIRIHRNDKGKFLWTFKILEANDDTIISIGIDSSEEDGEDDFCHSSSSIHYAFCNTSSWFVSDRRITNDEDQILTDVYGCVELKQYQHIVQR